jgi:[acyl-carrier-protein] S-malonyltransferase
MKIALLFPGYGSQFVGMGKELYDEYRIIQEYFEEASSCANVNFVKLCFASSDAEISKLANAYMSLFVIGSSVYQLLKEYEIIPDTVMGYNNGEMAALFAAGSITFPDGLYLLNKMSMFYEEALNTMDVSVARITGVSHDNLNALCKKINTDNDKVALAITESNEQHIVSGITEGIQVLYNLLEEQEKSAKLEYLSAEMGLHSLLMNGVVEQLKDYLEKVDFKDTVIPFISSVDGMVISQGLELKERFVQSIQTSLDFSVIVKKLSEYDIVIIATPAEKLGKIIKKAYPEKTIITIDKSADIEKFKEVIHVTQ